MLRFRKQRPALPQVGETAAGRAVVVGASVAGLASACALARSGWGVTLLERRPDLLEGGRAFLLQPNGLAALEALGALDAVRAGALMVSSVRFYLGGERPAAAYDYTELTHPNAYALEIRPQALRMALADRASQLGVPPPRFDCLAVVAVRDGDGGVAVRCRDGGGEEFECRADLVVGADGYGSQVRTSLGIGCRRISHADRYLLATVDARLETNEVRVYCGRGFANGVAPLPDGTYFWDCVTEETRQAVEARDFDAWRAIYEGRVPCAPEFTHALTRWEDLTPVEVRPFWAEASVVPGAILVGDAAGAVHPHSAQGANLALEDAAALGEALGREPAPQRGLLAWGRARRRKRRRYVRWSVLAGNSLDAPSLGWRFVRRNSFLWSHVGPMRRGVLKQQAGLGRI